MPLTWRRAGLEPEGPGWALQASQDTRQLRIRLLWSFQQWLSLPHADTVLDLTNSVPSPVLTLLGTASLHTSGYLCWERETGGLRGTDQTPGRLQPALLILFQGASVCVRFSQAESSFAYSPPVTLTDFSSGQCQTPGLGCRICARTPHSPGRRSKPGILPSLLYSLLGVCVSTL